MQKSFQLMISSLVVTGLLSSCTAMTQKSAEKQAPSSAEQEYTQIIAFGDSYSDDGASYEITNRMVDQGVKDSMIFPGDLYWQNRWTNGPTAVEVMADEYSKLIGEPKQEVFEKMWVFTSQFQKKFHRKKRLKKKLKFWKN